MRDLPSTGPACACLAAPLTYDHYEAVRFIGVDETEGRFGEVSLKQCRHCGRLWLHYLLEYESQPRAGRYFMGVISPESAPTITPQTAMDYLNTLDWHLYGGSYFSASGKSMGKVGPLY